MKNEIQETTMKKTSNVGARNVKAGTKPVATKKAAVPAKKHNSGKNLMGTGSTNGENGTFHGKGGCSGGTKK
jgi:hypothetical protein